MGNGRENCGNMLQLGLMLLFDPALPHFTNLCFASFYGMALLICMVKVKQRGLYSLERNIRRCSSSTHMSACSWWNHYCLWLMASEMPDLPL